MRYNVRLLIAISIAAAVSIASPGTFAHQKNVVSEKKQIPEKRLLNGTVRLVYWQGTTRVWSYFSDNGATCEIGVEAGESFSRVVDLANVCDKSAPLG